jgi:hypothetical protein
MQIEQHGKIEPTGTRRHIGDVTGPDPVCHGDPEAPFQQVFRRWQAELMGDRIAEAAFALGLNAMLVA